MSQAALAVPAEVSLGQFAERIFKRTYAYSAQEEWAGCTARVAKFVANGDTILERRFYNAILSRKFLPGGRYLYAAGREMPQTNNCRLMKPEESRDSWGHARNQAMQV